LIHLDGDVINRLQKCENVTTRGLRQISGRIQVQLLAGGKYALAVSSIFAKEGCDVA